MSHNLSKLHFGDYEVLDTPEGEPWILGEGAFATTYLAEHRFLKAVRALKVIRPEALAREGMRERVRSEAIEQSKLKHPGIAAVFDAFDSGERLCIVLEYCNGGSLARLAAERGPLPVPVAFMIGAQAASAMDYAHRRGLIHRDIKPENILLHRDEEDSTVQAKLIDFGLAMRAENESSIASVRASGFVGSPLYASPEQLRSSSLGPGSDLFSIGITLWYLLIGRVPFDGDAFAIALDRGSEQSYEPRLPGSLRGTPRAIIAGLIQKNAQDRCATSGDLYQMLVAWLQSESPHGVELESGWGFAAPVLQSPPRSSRKDSTGESLLPSRDRRTVGDFLIPWEAQAVGSSTLGSVMQGRDPGSGREVEITRLLPHFEPAVGDRIQGLVQRMVLAGMPGLLPALSFRSLGDGQLLITDCPGHLRLMDLVRAAPAGGWPFADALPLLAKIAEAMDDASELGLPSLLVEPSDIELVPAGVRAEQAFKTMLRPSADRQSLRETPLSEWQVLFQPVFLLETETSTRSSTGLSNASPEQTLLEQKSRFSYSMAFASLLCWVLCGRPPSRHLAGIPGLSGEASRIISQILQRERHAADCGSIFGELCRAEGLTAANPHEEEVQRLIQTGDSNLAAITQRLPDLEQQIQALEQKRSLLPEVARKQLDAPAEEIGRSFSQVSEKLQELNRQRAALPRSADHLGEAGSAKGLLVVKELRRFEEDCRRLQADLRKIEQNLVDAEEESARLDAEALEQETRERHQSRLLDQLKQAAGGVPALQDRCAAYWTRYATLSEETRHILSQVETTATGLKSPDPWHLKIKTLSVRWEASIGRWNSFQAEMESIATILNADFSPLQPLTEIEAAAASVQAAGIRLREIESSGAALASEAAVLQGQANTLLKEVTDQAAREELEALSVTGRLAKSALSRAEAAIQVAGEAGHRLVALSQLLQNALGQDVDLRPEAEALLGQIPTLPSWHEVLPDCQAAALAAQSRDSTNHESAAAETERLATAICDRSEAFVAETQRIEAATAQFQQALDSAGLARNAAALRLQITGLLQ
jgi:serine/threonine protein kinase